MKLKEFSLASVIATVNVTSALAHHSFATFDAIKRITLEGVVKEFQWTNPHSWILLTVPDARGRPEQWAIELGGPSSLARQGWVPRTITSGMRIQAVIHPLKDGTPGGLFVAVTLPDGTQLGNSDSGATAGAGGAAQ